MKQKLLWFGIGGSALTALCCFTSLLPAVLTGLGLTGLIGLIYTDTVLLPLLALFLLLTVYAVWRQRSLSQPEDRP